MIELLVAFGLVIVVFFAGYGAGWVHGREDTLEDVGRDCCDGQCPFFVRNIK